MDAVTTASSRFGQKRKCKTNQKKVGVNISWGKALAKKGKQSRKQEMMTEAFFFLDKAKDKNNRREGSNTVRRLMLAKKGEESRKWVIMGEAFFFGQSQG